MPLLKSILPLVATRRLNCYRSSITGFSRDVYSRLYSNYLVLPDGSTIRIRYPEPRHLVKVSSSAFAGLSFDLRLF